MHSQKKLRRCSPSSPPTMRKTSPVTFIPATAERPRAAWPAGKRYRSPITSRKVTKNFQGTDHRWLAYSSNKEVFVWQSLRGKSAAMPLKSSSGVPMRLLICLLAFALLIPATAAVADPSVDLETRRKALNDLLHEQWEYTMRTSPIYASILGDKRYNDQLDDFSQAAIDDNLEQTRLFLNRFEAIDTTGFPDQEVLNQQLMVRDLKMTLEGARFKPWEMPVSQENGIHIDAPQIVSVLSFESVKDYEDYIKRLNLLSTLFDQTIEQMRKGMAAGLMPPKILLEKVV